MNNISASMRRILMKPLGFSFRFMPKINQAVEQGLTVFVFHDVTDQPSQFAEEYGIAVSTKTFLRQIRWIQSNFNVIHPADILNDTNIPKHAAIITFDDGFLGSFENGLAILEKQGVPSVVFLNMQAILEQKPILSAVACYLNRYVPEFADFAKSIALFPPYHLTLTPAILAAFEDQYGTIDHAPVLDYQGAFADLNVVRAWDGKELVVFGNHLYDHWNAPALSPEELEDQYKRNESALSLLKNAKNLFAFTNGQPETCFTERDVDLVKRCGAGKVFSSYKGVNRDPRKFLLGRLSLSERDTCENHFWFRLGRAVYSRQRT